MCELANEAARVGDQFVPTSSHSFYLKQWSKYLDWCNNNKLNENQIYSEDALLVDLRELTQKYAASSFWAFFLASIASS
jgi:hypothetical protein